MTLTKDPNEKNYNNNQKENDTREKDRSQEVDLPIPEKKNDEITTGINGEKPEKNTGQTGFKPELVKENETRIPEKNENKNSGFDPENKTDPARKEKRGDETERLERDDTTDPKTKDAKWQQDKINEANNQQGNQQQGNQQTGTKQNVDKAAKINDSREDSILDPPKTETYEKKQGENVGGIINKDNYTHAPEEKKRDDNNRKKLPSFEKQN